MKVLRLPILFIVSMVFLVSCMIDLSGGVADKIREIEQKYPAFNINITDMGIITPSYGTDTYDVKLLTVAEKRVFLNHMDIIKFVINAKEFEDEINRYEYHSTTKESGDGGSIGLNKKYDNDRLISSIRYFAYDLVLTKGYVSNSKDAQADIRTTLYDNPSLIGDTLGSCAYVENLDNIPRGHASIVISNKFILDDTSFSSVNTGTKIIFHSILKNMGFYPKENIDKPEEFKGTDLFGRLPQMIDAIYEDSNFKYKYEREIEEINGYHAAKFSKFLYSDSK